MTSISSITYYDGNNTSQTLATSIYELDAPNRRLRLQYLQSWKDVATRWDAVTFTIIAGYADAASVPGDWKRAMLLQIGKWFYQPDMTEHLTFANSKAYERIVARNARVGYP